MFAPARATDNVVDDDDEEISNQNEAVAFIWITHFVRRGYRAYGLRTIFFLAKRWAYWSASGDGDVDAAIKTRSSRNNIETVGWELVTYEYRTCGVRVRTRVYFMHENYATTTTTTSAYFTYQRYFKRRRRRYCTGLKKKAALYVCTYLILRWTYAPKRFRRIDVSRESKFLPNAFADDLSRSSGTPN